MTEDINANQEPCVDCNRPVVWCDDMEAFVCDDCGYPDGYCPCRPVLKMEDEVIELPRDQLGLPLSQ